MRTIGILVSALAVAAGFIVGRVEHQRELEATASAPDALDPVSAVLLKPDEPSPARESGDPGASVDLGARRSPSPSGEREEASDQPAKSAAEELPPGFRDGYEKLREQVDAMEFEAAAEAAARLIAQLDEANIGKTKARRLVLRVAARSRSFERLIAPIKQREIGETMYQVLLANGNTLDAMSVEERGDRYRIQLANGIGYEPRVEEVQRVTQVDGSVVAEREWEKLAPRVRALDDPIKLYVHGVQRCFQAGLKDQGMKLLERLLDVPGSAKVPALFATEDPDAAITDWLVASGDQDPFAAARLPGAGDGSTPPREDVPRAAPTGNLLEDLRNLRDEALTLYRRARSDGNPRDLETARGRIDEAFDLLDGVESTPEIDSLRRDLGQLLSDVIRVSPF